MTRILLLLLLTLNCLVAAADGKPASPVKSTRAAWIKLSGEVDQAMADYTKRAIGEAIKQKPDVIVFEINTFGGLLQAAFEIVDTITGIRDVPTVALVSQKAISAGALIALSCNKLYMKPATTIGDCAPIIQSQEGPQILGEKIQSPLRAKFRNLAQRNGYPELLSEAMVTPGLEIYRISNGDSVRYVEATDYDSMSDSEQTEWSDKKALVRPGELLTLTDKEAEELHFSKGTVQDSVELSYVLGLSSSFNVEVSWAETLSRWLSTIAPILLLLAFGALYLEFQAPGFGIFGVIGISLLVIVFGGEYVSGLADKLPLALLIVGIALILLEIVVFPGTWIAGLVGIGFSVAALILVLKDAQPVWTPQVPGVPLDGLGRASVMVIGSAIAAMLIPVLASRYLLAKLPKGVSPVLEGALESTGSPQEGEISQVQLGEKGVTLTALKVAGRVRFTTTTLEVQSRSGFLDPGVHVHVVAIEHGKVFVAADPSEAK